MRAPVLALACMLAGTAGCGGGDGEGGGGSNVAASTQTGATTTAPAAAGQRCAPGEHGLTLPNGRPARMRVTPGTGERALAVVLHGAGGTPASALDAFRGGWNEQRLVLIAPAAKGQTWSILRSEADLDLESVNLALAAAYERCRIDRRRIAIGGFSDGATYALTVGLSNGDLFPAIMALSPGGIVGGEQRGVPRVFVSHGTEDTVLPIARAGDSVVRTLREAGYPVTYRRFRGGHEASPETSAAAIRWFLEG